MVENIWNKKWKIAICTGLVSLMTAAGIYAFREVSVVYKAVTEKVDVRLEEYTVRDGKEQSWEDGNEVMAGDFLSKIPRISNDGADCYVRAAVVFESDRETGSPLTEKNLEGITDAWVQRGNYFYYKKVLKAKEHVDVFQGIRMPSDWKSGEDDGKKWNAKVRVDAVQAAYFRPDFESEDPWGVEQGRVSIQRYMKEALVNQEEKTEPVELVIGSRLEGFTVDTQEFFRELESFIPGRAQSGKVKISNKLEEPREIFLKIQFPEENPLMEQMELTIQKRRGNRIEMLYHGPVRSEKFLDYGSLGQIDGNTTEAVEFLLYLPENIDNTYASSQGTVRFWFSSDPKGEEISVKSPGTGDSSAILFYLIPVCVIPCMAAIIWKKERKKTNG
ncbi:MAG: hypothetical protein MR436_07815 [Eubacterium sp.]|nr:hypothetical protein [Eubacterium sp.]